MTIYDKIKKHSLILLFGSVTLSAFSQQYRSPVDFPLSLSANFGELRNNHFHSGIDMKTQGVTGKPVLSVEDGYISRINISPGGYGWAIYVAHPNGQTSVYGHLDRFAPKIGEYVKKMQYERETFAINLEPDQNLFPVKKGDLIAYSGNSGSSGGPHIHFEIRDSQSQNILDPLVYYKDVIKDTQAPDVRGIAAYPIPGRGVVNGSIDPLRQNISLLKNGSYSALKTPIDAWGLVGFGVKSYDRMTGTNNIYGVKIVRLWIDDELIFQSDIESYAFDETRMLNSFTDFVDWRQNKSFFMKSFVEPGNTLSFYKTKDDGYNGYYLFNKEKVYNLKYELEDLYGNKTTYPFSVSGKEQPLPRPSGCSLVMVWDENNRYISEDFTLIIPKGNLYNDVCFKLTQTASSDYYSNIFAINNTPVPLHKSGEVKIKMTSDPIANKKQYGLVQINGTKKSWIDGTYNNGYVTASIRELGMKVAVSADQTPPTITPVTPNKWVQNETIKIKATDNLSGIASFRGTIDGQFVLFEHDVKSPIYSYKLDPSRLKKGQNHKLVFTVIDACGNKTEYTDQFYY